MALSGGPDSLALTAVAARSADHGADRGPSLQPDSDQVAATARDQAMALGCVDAQVLCVDVGTAGGPEAAARTARYLALDAARGDAPVLLAHTLDDQAETVLLGLGRGPGHARSPACGPATRRGAARCWRSTGRHRDGAWEWASRRGMTRTMPIAGFTRSRLRTEVLPLLEDVLGGGVAEALARTAPRCVRTPTRSTPWPASLTAVGASRFSDVKGLARLSEAVRRRVIRRGCWPVARAG